MSTEKPPPSLADALREQEENARTAMLVAIEAAAKSAQLATELKNAYAGIQAIRRMAGGGSL